MFVLSAIHTTFCHYRSVAQEHNAMRDSFDNKPQQAALSTAEQYSPLCELALTAGRTELSVAVVAAAMLRC